MERILVLAITLTFFVCGCGPDLSQYDYLKEPQIRTMPGQKMIAVKVLGDPNVVSKEAIKRLYKTRFNLKGKKRPEDLALRARWPKPLNTPKNEWIGIYGLPIPESIEALPAQKKDSKPLVKIEYWEYGLVVEILHIGSYSKEAPAIEKLHQFIEDSGYKITGVHEEEYLKGPGMFFKGNPSRYRTIIRCRVEKEGEYDGKVNH
jgi:hypothetical protein